MELLYISQERYNCDYIFAPSALLLMYGVGQQWGDILYLLACVS